MKDRDLIILTKFFDRLIHISERLDIPKHKEFWLNSPSPKENLLSHLRSLRKVTQMELVFRQRNVSSTQSSWKTIVEKLKPFGVFKEFEGNKALKNALSDFLMGIYD